MHEGYSNTALIKKLGIKPEHKVLLINKPLEYFDWLEVDLTNQFCGKKELPDIVHLFAKTKKEFEEELKKIQQRMKLTTVIWISWYKKNSGMQTDLTENDIRNYALQNNLVDIKVCAVNNEWSGLKLVVPLEKR